MANLDEIQIKISQDSSGASKAIDSLIDSLEKLSTKTDLGTSAQNIKSLGNSIRVLSKATESFNANNIAEQIGAIPEAMKSLGNLPVGEMEKFTSTIQTLSDVLEPLSQKAGSIATVLTALNQLPKSVQKAILENQKLEESNNKVAKSFRKVAKVVKVVGKIATWGVGLGTISKGLQNSLTLATDYAQTVNMLNIVMGEGAEEAKDFAEELGAVLGLNPADTMKFQATFHNLFVGFGNDMKSAQLMSKNLTQLSYDMAAFYGELVGSSPEAAAEKLRLGIAGTIEPIQRLGYAIKEADLQAVAARQGFNVNIRNLNTASKSMLRYIAIMEQSTHVQGHMAKSFSSPATALIVFKSALKQISTEIGETFLPMIMAAIPYMQAFARGVLNMVKTINGILGIELPQIDFSKSKKGISGIGDEAEKTGKKMQKAFTLGIDELNVLDSKTSDATDGMQDITPYLKLPEYNMLEGFSGDKLKEIEDKLKPLEPLFDGLAITFAGFYDAIKGFTDSYLYPWLVNIGNWMKNNPETVQNLGGFLGGVAIALLALKGVGSLVELFGIPKLITGIKFATEWLGKHKLSWWNVLGVALLVYGAFTTISAILDLIRGKGDFADNIRKALSGIYIILVSWIVGKAIPLVLTNFTAFAAKSSIIWTKFGAAGSAAMLGIVAIAALALANILSNWGDASYKIQQVFGKAIKWMADKGVWLGQKYEEISGNIKKLFVDIAATLVKAMAKAIDFLFGRQIKPVLAAVDSIFNTNWSEKLSVEGISKATDDFATELKLGIDDDVKEKQDMWQQIGDTINSAMDKYLANSEAMHDEYLAKEAKKAEEERKKQEEELQKQMDEMTKSIQDSMGNIEEEMKMDIPEFEMPQLPEDFQQSVDLQTEANEIAEAAKTLQTDYTDTSLQNESEIMDTLGMANTLQQSQTADIVSMMKGIGAGIINAIRRVEDACRDIRIEVNNYYGGAEGFATGGYPTSGEMFFARENGIPEMVGRVGRRTAVMNNGQIADTMAQSLIRAMGQGGATSQPQVIENKLYLDGEVVYSNQQKIQRSKGYNLGMGVFANV